MLKLIVNRLSMNREVLPGVKITETEGEECKDPEKQKVTDQEITAVLLGKPYPAESTRVYSCHTPNVTFQDYFPACRFRLGYESHVRGSQCSWCFIVFMVPPGQKKCLTILTKY